MFFIYDGKKVLLSLILNIIIWKINTEYVTWQMLSDDSVMSHKPRLTKICCDIRLFKNFTVHSFVLIRLRKTCTLKTLLHGHQRQVIEHIWSQFYLLGFTACFHLKLLIFNTRFNNKFIKSNRSGWNQDLHQRVVIIFVWFLFRSIFTAAKLCRKCKARTRLSYTRLDEILSGSRNKYPCECSLYRQSLM